MHWLSTLLVSGPVWTLYRLIRYKIKSFWCVLNKTKQSLKAFTGTSHLSCFRVLKVHLEWPCSGQWHFLNNSTCVCVKFVHVKVFLELLSRYFHQLNLQLFLLVNLERGTVIFSSHFLWNKQNISGFFVCSFLSACLAREHHLSMGWIVKDICPVKTSFHICMYVKTNKRHEVGLYFRKLSSRLLTTWLLAGHETGIGINISLWRDGY